ncbi:uncharacterized protein LOC102547703 isoform X2 [Rattus norvegicus]|uniref:uncharacterized protein LOC102547703 isoform X2 n=1 Tax=Rattus norvegicus TaxID=10116 RepID=UPI002FD7A3F1
MTMHESPTPLRVLHFVRTGVTHPVTTQRDCSVQYRAVSKSVFKLAISQELSHTGEIQCFGSRNNKMALVLMLLDSPYTGLGGDTDIHQLNKSDTEEGQCVWFQLQIDPGLIELSALLWQGWSPRIGWTLVRGPCLPAPCHASCPDDNGLNFRNLLGIEPTAPAHSRQMLCHLATTPALSTLLQSLTKLLRVTLHLGGPSRTSDYHSPALASPRAGITEFDMIILLALWTSLATIGTEKEENPPPPTNPRSIPFYQPPCSCMGREWRPQLPSRTGIKPRPFRSGQSDPREGAETASLRCKIPVLASGNPKTRTRDQDTLDMAG